MKWMIRMIFFRFEIGFASGYLYLLPLACHCPVVTRRGVWACILSRARDKIPFMYAADVQVLSRWHSINRRRETGGILPSEH